MNDLLLPSTEPKDKIEKLAQLVPGYVPLKVNIFGDLIEDEISESVNRGQAKNELSEFTNEDLAENKLSESTNEDLAENKLSESTNEGLAENKLSESTNEDRSVIGHPYMKCTYVLDNKSVIAFDDPAKRAKKVGTAITATVLAIIVLAWLVKRNKARMSK